MEKPSYSVAFRLSNSDYEELKALLQEETENISPPRSPRSVGEFSRDCVLFFLQQHRTINNHLKKAQAEKQKAAQKKEEYNTVQL